MKGVLTELSPSEIRHTQGIYSNLFFVLKKGGVFGQ